MKPLFYPRLAWDGLRKNKRMSIPYLMTCVVMTAMFYILSYLSYSESTKVLRGGESLSFVLRLGSFVMLVFSAIFLFYTNSFLLRRRRQEFGLYHVLGMSKKNLAYILTWESLISAAVSLIAGLFCGIGLSKLAEMGLVKLLGGVNGFRFQVNLTSVSETAGYYALIFAFIWLVSLIRISRSGTMELLKSASVGEKPPKARWLLAVLGAGMLAVAYYLAVTVGNPIDALALFFIAVILVIVATYLLFIAGSVALCKLLQKKKNYYYRPDHFVSVSSMAYRMKRNGAGLASVCVIATMVLVMISSSSSLFFGSQSALESRYPRELNFSALFQTPEELTEENLSRFRQVMADAAEEKGASVTNWREYGCSAVVGLIQDNGEIECDSETVDVVVTNKALRQFCFVRQADYEAITGETLTIPAGEAALFTYHCTFEGDALRFRGITEIPVCSSQKGSVPFGDSDTSFIGVIVVVMPEPAAAVAPFGSFLDTVWEADFDTGLEAQAQEECSEAVIEAIRSSGLSYFSFRGETRASGTDDFYGSNGGLFFIGILLSIVFILAAVLILYYKQLSEGYEDQPRFAIMRKVGMTDREIRKSINSQLLTVFFAPLLFASLHLAFAFPIVNKLLMLFNLFDTRLFALVTVGSVLVFGLFYALVYRVTSRTYYHIVRSGQSHG